MNKRTAYRLLWRNRQRTFWGDRAFLSLAIERAVVPEPLPPDPFSAAGWVPGPFVGYYEQPDGTRSLRVSKMSWGSADPPQPSEGGAKIREARQSLLSTSWEWWEAAIWDNAVSGKPVFVEDVSDEAFAQYRAREQWFERYVHGVPHEPEMWTPSVAALLDVGTWARNSFVSEQGDRLIWTWSVKWRYPNRRHKFAAAVARAVNTLHRHGWRARVWKRALG